MRATREPVADWVDAMRLLGYVPPEREDVIPPVGPFVWQRMPYRYRGDR